MAEAGPSALTVVVALFVIAGLLRLATRPGRTRVRRVKYRYATAPAGELLGETPCTFAVGRRLTRTGAWPGTSRLEVHREALVVEVGPGFGTPDFVRGSWILPRSEVEISLVDHRGWTTPSLHLLLDGVQFDVSGFPHADWAAWLGTLGYSVVPRRRARSPQGS